MATDGMPWRIPSLYKLPPISRDFMLTKQCSRKLCVWKLRQSQTHLHCIIFTRSLKLYPDHIFAFRKFKFLRSFILYVPFHSISFGVLFSLKIFCSTVMTSICTNETEFLLMTACSPKPVVFAMSSLYAYYSRWIWTICYGHRRVVTDGQSGLHLSGTVA